MTNEQKFTNAEERNAAYRAYIADFTRPIIGQFEWLALEAEEEKLEPCFFCGNKYLAITKDGNNLWSVSCTACLYESRHHENRDAAIAAHNRVCHAVEAVKKGDVK